MPTIHIASAKEFKSHIDSGKVVLVDFHATWCGPCKAVAPRFETLSNEYKNVTFLKVDCDQCQDVSQECGIRGMPTFQFYQKGRRLDEVVGADIGKVETLLKKYASAAGGGFPSTGGRTLGGTSAATAKGTGIQTPAWTMNNGLLFALIALVVYLWLNKP